MAEDQCRFCGVKWNYDGTDEHQWKMLAIHVWMHHDETDRGISLKDTMKNGPTEEEEE